MSDPFSKPVEKELAPGLWVYIPIPKPDMLAEAAGWAEKIRPPFRVFLRVDPSTPLPAELAKSLPSPTSEGLYPLSHEPLKALASNEKMDNLVVNQAQVMAYMAQIARNATPGTPYTRHNLAQPVQSATLQYHLQERTTGGQGL